MTHALKDWRHISWPYALIVGIFALVALGQRWEYMSGDIQGRHTGRQAFTMWNVRNFVRYDPNILNPREGVLNHYPDQIVRLEFPILQWSMAMGQRMFGEHRWVWRSMLWLLGLASVVGMFLLVRLMTGSPPAAACAAILMQCCPVFYFYSVVPLPDVLALCGSIWYLYFTLSFEGNARKVYLFGAGCGLLVATLAKLPFLMLSVVSIYFVVRDLFVYRRARWGYIFTLLLLISPGLIWYAWVIPQWGDSKTMHGILDGGLFTAQNAEYWRFNRDIVFPYWIVTPAAWLPFVAGVAFLVLERSEAWILVASSMTLLFFLIELPAIANIHDYYLLPMLPWVYATVGCGAARLLHMHRASIYVLLAICVWAGLRAPTWAHDHFSLEASYFNSDVILGSAYLSSLAPMHAKAITVNEEILGVFAYYIDKRSHAYSNDTIPPPWIEDMIVNHGVKYLYSDSPAVHENPEVRQYFKQFLGGYGSVRVFELALPDAQ